jgi:hypothetical protein
VGHQKLILAGWKADDDGGSGMKFAALITVFTQKLPGRAMWHLMQIVEQH